MSSTRSVTKDNLGVRNQRKRIAEYEGADSLSIISKLDKLMWRVQRRQHRPDDHRHGTARAGGCWQTKVKVARGDSA